MLELPECVQSIISLQLSECEKAMCTDVMEQTVQKLDEIVSKKESIAKYNILFTAVMQLRRLCSIGTYLATKTIQAELSNISASSCTLCSEARDSRENLISASFSCSRCSGDLERISPGEPVSSLQVGNLNCVKPAEKITGFSTKLNAIVDCIGKEGNGCKE